MTSLCRYKDIFGKPNEGAHKYRFLGLAVVDLLATVVVAFITHRLWPQKFTLIQAFLMWFALGVVAHLLFCVNTPITRILKA